MAIVWTALGPLVVAACYALAEAPRRLLRATADAAVGSILQALAAKDHAVGGHSGDVADLAVAVGRRLGMAGAGAGRAPGRRRPPRPRQARRAAGDPRQARAARRPRSGRSSAATPPPARRSCSGYRRSRTWGRCCARCTSTGTAAATRTGSGRRADPPAGPHRDGLRRLRGDHQRAPLRREPVARGRGGGAARGRGDAVRPARGRRLPAGAARARGADRLTGRGGHGPAAPAGLLAPRGGAAPARRPGSARR